MISLTHLFLEKLCRKFEFDLENDDVILFAIRGSIDTECQKGKFKIPFEETVEKKIIKAKINYKNPKCLIGIWNRRNQILSIFPGSTVPSLTYLVKNPHTQIHFNILSPGMYELSFGLHPKDENGIQRHEAFIMNAKGVFCTPKIVRKGRLWGFDECDLTYKVWYPGDNLHASRAEIPTFTNSKTFTKKLFSSLFSSSGCITVLGQPQEYSSDLDYNQAKWNAWVHFYTKLKKIRPSQNLLKFLLFDFSDFESDKKMGSVLRYGSSGSNVLFLQNLMQQTINTKLNQFYYNADLDGKFKNLTAEAGIHFISSFFNNPSFEIDIEHLNNCTKHFKLIQKPIHHVVN